MVAVVRDRLAAFLYWAAYWLERAADQVWYGYGAIPEGARLRRRWKR